MIRSALSPVFFVAALACAPTPSESEESNLCGTIDAPASASPVTGVAIVSVLEGQTACFGGDTGGAAWWGDVVASPEPDGDHFEATVPVGTYGVEVYTGGDYGGCAEAVVTDASACSADIVVQLGADVPVDKPNLYLYPPKPTDMAVRLPAWRRLTESDPRYPVDGWRVKAWPDGHLDTRVGGRDYLFYEMNYELSRFQQEEGWCVAGPLAQLSIEEAMEDLGFLPNEIADFSTAWDGDFPEARWMTVYPQFDGLATVNIDPAPDSFLRAWFIVSEGCRPVQAPEMPTVVRSGFHAAEWGVAFESPLSAPRVVVFGG